MPTAERGRGGRGELQPDGAIRLFDGRDLAGWQAIGGGPAGWQVDAGHLVVVPGAGDIETVEAFRHFHLHLEFWLPHLPEAGGQDKANSGVYVLGRYEIQILDSFGDPVANDGCGAIYKHHAPALNASLPAETWQSYDVAFRAPTLDTNGFVAEPARITVLHNGVVIHNNLPLLGPTEGAEDPYEARRGALRLQEHGAPVRFRNIWLLPQDGGR